MTTYDPDQLIEHFAARAVRGLHAVSQQAQRTMERSRAHGDVTGATRASRRAYVVGPGLIEQAGAAAAAASGLGAAQALNPGHGASASYSLPASTVGVVLTAFTDYAADLEVEHAGQKAVLRPALELYLDRLTRAAAEGQ